MRTVSRPCFSRALFSEAPCLSLSRALLSKAPSLRSHSSPARTSSARTPQAASSLRMATVHNKGRQSSHCEASSQSAESSASEAASSFSTIDASPVRGEDGSLAAAPGQAGIYAFYSKDGELQYIGLSRKVRPRALRVYSSCWSLPSTELRCTM